MLCSYVRIYWTDDGQSLDSSLCTVRTVVLVRSGTGIIIQYSNITIRTGRTVTSPADEDGRLVGRQIQTKQTLEKCMDGWGGRSSWVQSDGVCVYIDGVCILRTNHNTVSMYMEDTSHSFSHKHVCIC